MGLYLGESCQLHSCLSGLNILEGLLKYRTLLGIWGSPGALAFYVFVTFAKNFAVFVYNPTAGQHFDYKNLITGYIGIPVFLEAYLVYKLFYQTRLVKLEEVDLHSGLDEIGLYEMEFEAAEAEKLAKQSRMGRFYRHYLSWLF